MSQGPTTTTTGSNTGSSNTTGSSSTNLTGTNNTVGTTAGQEQGATTGATSGATSSSTGAWAPAVPLLQTQLQEISALQGSGALTPGETAGIQGISDAADANAALNSNIVGDAKGMLNGGGFGAGNADISQGYDTLKNSLSSYANGDHLDPSKDAPLQQELDAIRYGANNSTNSTFSAAGRGGPTEGTGDVNGSMAAAREGAYARAAAPALLSWEQGAQDRQINAANNIAAGGINKSTALNASASGMLGAETAAPSFLASDMAPGQALFDVNQTAQFEPLMYQGAVNNTLLPIAQSGSTGTGTSSGTSAGTSTNNTTGQSTSNNTVNMLQNATNQSKTKSSGTSTGTSTTTTPIGTTALGVGSSLLGAWLGSDPRMKKDAAPVGMLFDGTPVHKFKYKGSNTTRIGLMSPQVQQRNPAAVKTGKDGLQRVNYDLATRQAQRAAPLLGGGY